MYAVGKLKALFLCKDKYDFLTISLNVDSIEPLNEHIKDVNPAIYTRGIAEENVQLKLENQGLNEQLKIVREAAKAKGLPTSSEPQSPPPSNHQ